MELVPPTLLLNDEIFPQEHHVTRYEKFHRSYVAKSSSSQYHFLSRQVLTICTEITMPVLKNTFYPKAYKPRKSTTATQAHLPGACPHKTSTSATFPLPTIRTSSRQWQRAAAGHSWGLFHMSTMEMSWAPKVSCRRDTEPCRPARLRHTPKMLRLLLVQPRSPSSLEHHQFPGTERRNLKALQQNSWLTIWEKACWGRSLLPVRELLIAVKPRSNNHSTLRNTTVHKALQFCPLPCSPVFSLQQQHPSAYRGWRNAGSVLSLKYLRQAVRSQGERIYHLTIQYWLPFSSVLWTKQR